VNRAQSQGAKEMDDNYVGMHLALAQRLLYGGGERKVSSIVVQLKRSEDMARARARLDALFAEHKLRWKCATSRSWRLRSTRSRLPSGRCSLSVTAILGIIVLFTIANTMGMSVMERTNEIGTARGPGVSGGAAFGGSLLEGAIIGVIGATARVIAIVADLRDQSRSALPIICRSARARFRCI